MFKPLRRSKRNLPISQENVRIKMCCSRYSITKILALDYIYNKLWFCFIKIIIFSAIIKGIDCFIFLFFYFCIHLCLCNWSRTFNRPVLSLKRGKKKLGEWNSVLIVLKNFSFKFFMNGLAIPLLFPFIATVSFEQQPYVIEHVPSLSELRNWSYWMVCSRAY